MMKIILALTVVSLASLNGALALPEGIHKCLIKTQALPNPILMDMGAVTDICSSFDGQVGTEGWEAICPDNANECAEHVQFSKLNEDRMASEIVDPQERNYW